MKGPFSVTDIGYYVEQDSMGVYIFSRDGKTAIYVGRSDNDLRGRMLSSSNEGHGYKYFWFKYVTSPMRAYQLECEWYHKYEPRDNTIHPAVPQGAFWRCPVSRCEWS